MLSTTKCKVYKEKKLLKYKLLTAENKNLVLWIISGMQTGTVKGGACVGLKPNDPNLTPSCPGEWLWRILEVKILRSLEDSNVGIECISVVDFGIVYSILKRIKIKLVIFIA